MLPKGLQLKFNEAKSGPGLEIGVLYYYVTPNYNFRYHSCKLQLN